MKKFAFIILGAAAVGVVLLFTVTHISFPTVNVAEELRPARALLAGVGGTDELCRESSEILNRIEAREESNFASSELTQFPAVATLQSRNHVFVDGIVDDGFRYIKVRVYIHSKHASAYAKRHPTSIRIGNSCVFVHT
jgi:hypothetical protein